MANEKSQESAEKKMALNEANIRALIESRQRITIFGKFTAKAEDVKARRIKPIVLRDAGEADGKVSAAGFFSAVRPQLGSIRESIEVGNSRINAFRLCEPSSKECDPKKVFPVLMDSPLLSALDATTGGEDQEDSQKRQLQVIGGQIFKKLVENLDIVAKYSGAAFTGQILETGAQYIPRWVNSQVSGVDRSWQTGVSRVLMTDPEASDLVVNYLTCYPQDEKSILIRFRERLVELSGELEMGGKKDLIDLTRDALAACKQDLDDERSDEGILGVLFSSRDFQHLTRCKDPVGLQTDSFVKHYAHFMRSSNDIQRFSRSESLHSFLMVWFASKFATHDEDSYKASEVMFERCVQKQKNRIPSLKQSELRELQELVDEIDMDEATRLVVNGKDSTAEMQSNFERNRTFRKRRLKTILTLPRKVTRELWGNALRDLFVSVAQMSGGAVESLHKRDEMLAKKYEKFYIDILRQDLHEKAGRDTKEADKVFLSPEAFMVKAKKSLMDRALTDEREFVEEIFDITEDLPQDVRALRWMLTRRCVTAWEKKCDSEFSKGYCDNFGEIKRELETLSRSYEHIVLKRTVSAKESSSGSIHVVTDMVLPKSISNSKEARVNRVEKMLKSMEATAATAAKQAIREAVSTPKGLTPGKYKFVASDGAKLPSSEIEIKSEKEGGETTFNSTVAELEKLPEASLVKEENGSQTLIPVATLDIAYELDRFASTAALDKEESPTLDSTREMDKIIGERIESIRSAYVSDAENPDLEMGYRALLFGEYVLAAPKDAVNLGEEDLSGVLAIIMDLIQTVGSDPSKNKDLYSNAKLQETDMRLEGVNLSKYYRLSDAYDLDRIIQYHYHMCEEAANQRPYLQEIVDIGRVLDEISGTGVEVVIYDMTLAEHAETNDADKFCMVRHPSAFTFLSGQCLASQGWNAFRGKYKEYLGSSAAGKLQFPVFVSPQPVSDGAPIISPSNVSLPKFTARDHDGEKQTFLVDRVVQETPHLLLCVSALVDRGNFGKVTTAYDDNVRFARDHMNGFGLKKGSPVFDMLKHLWRANENLASLVFLTRLYSAARLLRFQNGLGDAGHSIALFTIDDYEVIFGKIQPLGSFLPEPGKTVLSGPVVNNPQGAAFAADGQGNKRNFKDVYSLKAPSSQSEDKIPFKGFLKISKDAEAWRDEIVTAAATA